jgi:SAM-dependent methyltransferase
MAARSMRLGLYDHSILPRLTHLVMRNPRLASYRERAVARARGKVLEIGMGSGLNLPFYGHKMRRVLGVEPCTLLVRLAREGARKCRFPVEASIGSPEALPLPDASIDTVVTTWSLCSIPDPLTALREARRVLARLPQFGPWSEFKVLVLLDSTMTGRHYRAAAGRFGFSAVVVMRGGGWGGRVSLSRCSRSSWSRSGWV